MVTRKSACGWGLSGKAVVSFVWLVVWGSSGVASGEEGGAAGISEITGKVLDESGKGVAGATVWVIGFSEVTDLALIVQGKTDTEGRYKLKVMGTRAGTVVARGAESAFSAKTFWSADSGSASDVNLTVVPGVELTIQVHDETQKPISQAEVAYLFLNIDEELLDKEHPGYVSRVMLREIGWRIEPSDESGMIRIRDFPRGRSASVQVGHIKFADAALDAIAPRDEAYPITLEQGTEMRVRAEREGDHEPLAGVHFAGVAQSKGKKAVILGGLTDMEGMVTFRLPALDSGELCGSHSELLAKQSVSIRNWPPQGDEAVTAVVEFQRAVEVRGRVVEKSAGRGVASASVEFVPDLKRKEVIGKCLVLITAEQYGISDSEGEYQIRVPAEPGVIRCTDAIGYTTDWRKSLVKVNPVIGQANEASPIELTRRNPRKSSKVEKMPDGKR